MRRGALDLELFPRELIALEQIAAEGVWDLIDEAMASPRVVRPKLGAAPLLGAVSLDEFIGHSREQVPAPGPPDLPLGPRVDLKGQLVFAVERELAGISQPNAREFAEPVAALLSVKNVLQEPGLCSTRGHA